MFVHRECVVLNLIWQAVCIRTRLLKTRILWNSIQLLVTLLTTDIMAQHLPGILANSCSAVRT